MIEAKVDTTRLNLAMARFAKESRKDVDKVIVDKAKTMVAHLIAITPPGKRRGADFLNKKGYISKDAFTNAKGKIKGDLNRLFPTTAIKDEGRIKGMIESGHLWKIGGKTTKVGSFVQNFGAAKAAHQRSRNSRTGRVRVGRSGANKFLTRKAIKNQLAKELIGNIGILNAGWRRAYDQLKAPRASMPAWVKRHPAKPGHAKITKRKAGITVSMGNRVSYYPKDTAQRIQQAVNRTTKGIEGEILHILEKRAQRTNRRMNQ